jgi:hypothetical protein
MKKKTKKKKTKEKKKKKKKKKKQAADLFVADLALPRRELATAAVRLARVSSKSVGALDLWPELEIGLCRSRVARFTLVQHNTTGKTNDHKDTKMATQKIQNNRKIDKMAIKYIYLPLKDRTKFTRLGIFGLKIYDLAPRLQVYVHVRLHINKNGGKLLTRV